MLSRVRTRRVAESFCGACWSAWCGNREGLGAGSIFELPQLEARYRFREPPSSEISGISAPVPSPGTLSPAQGLTARENSTVNVVARTSPKPTIRPPAEMGRQPPRDRPAAAGRPLRRACSPGAAQGQPDFRRSSRLRAEFGRSGPPLSNELISDVELTGFGSETVSGLRSGGPDMSVGWCVPSLAAPQPRPRWWQRAGAARASSTPPRKLRHWISVEGRGA